MPAFGRALFGVVFASSRDGHTAAFRRAALSVADVHFTKGGGMAVPVTVRTASPSYQAYQLLYIAFTIAPIIAGIDKFFHFLVNWDQYLSPMVARALPMAPH